jgi:hypothetical protein
VRARARELYDDGHGCNAIAKQLHVAPSTISAGAKQEGLKFDRSQTELAVRAHVVDLRQGRALLRAEDDRGGPRCRRRPRPALPRLKLRRPLPKLVTENLGGDHWRWEHSPSEGVASIRSRVKLVEAASPVAILALIENRADEDCICAAGRWRTSSGAREAPSDCAIPRNPPCPDGSERSDCGTLG